MNSSQRSNKSNHFVFSFNLSFFISMIFFTATNLQANSNSNNVNFVDKKSSESNPLQSRNVNSEQSDSETIDTEENLGSDLEPSLKKTNKKALRRHKDWSLNTPAWFFPFKSDSFFVSFEVSQNNTAAKSDVFQGSEKSGTSSNELNNTNAQVRLGYAFQMPLFLMLEVHTTLRSTNKIKISNTLEKVSSVIDPRISEPKFSVGGVHPGQIFAFGGEFSYTPFLGPKTNTFEKDSSDNIIKETHNIMNGGDSVSLKAFGSFDFSEILLDFGFDHTEFGVSKQKDITINSDGTVHTSQTNYQSKKENRFYFGFQFEKSANLGIHLSRSEWSLPVVKDGGSSAGATNSSNAKSLFFNSIEVSVKFRPTKTYVIRPALEYSQLDEPSLPDYLKKSNLKIFNTTLRLGLDFSF